MKKIKENKGFSLVELIIVIAIMAILVGVVGTQVVPYLNKSREAKDYQVIAAYNTAFVSAFSMAAADINPAADMTVIIYGDSETKAADSATGAAIVATMKELTATDTIAQLTGKLKTTKGGTVAAIKTTYSGSTKKAVTQAYSDKDCTDGKEVFDAIESQL